ncbi:hypothetical protein HanXRQr2_Chr10g0446811 [Helianthus annuus]|uniref:Uncharacterized protein n=1 Tax=Helianthus annuus TaxID=4232 RepID=A0A9K3N4R7_HELAN|nr:hypothetical protein HanXRQr2_Chr10g0446811 [Helianthus annuus]
MFLPNNSLVYTQNSHEHYNYKRVYTIRSSIHGVYEPDSRYALISFISINYT